MDTFSEKSDNDVNVLRALLNEKEQQIQALQKVIADQAILLRSQTTFMQERSEEKQQQPFFHQVSDDASMIDALLGIGDTSWEYFSEQKKEWHTLFENQYNKYHLKEEKKKEKYWKDRMVVINFMFGWLFMHMQSKQIKPPQIVVQLSIILFHYGCTQTIWRLLHKLKLCLSCYEKTRKLMEEAGKVPIAAKLKWTKEPSIAVFGADNCSYYNHQSFVHDNKPTHFLSTINWYQRYWSEPFQHHLTAGCELFTDDFLPNKSRFM